METEEYLPLTEAVFFILLSISPGPRHGYAILKDVESLSGGRVLLSTGTLYGALKRMLVQEWIERVDDPQPNPTDRERKAYALTPHGRSILNAELARLKRMVSAASLQPVEEGG